MKFLEELAARQRFGISPGLETIRSLLAVLGNPHERLGKVIHLAGTNGKGATSAMLDAALRARGFRVGRYTSPHLVRINERFFLDGQPIADERLEVAAERVFQAVKDSQGAIAPTFFEALTAIAFVIYSEAQLDYLVLETGLGGRLDATNVCHPVLSVITRIGLDHCDWLGDTVEKIAAEKAGIIKPGVPVVVGKNTPEVLTVLRQAAAARGSKLIYAPDFLPTPTQSPLPGAFNRENAQTAQIAFQHLWGQAPNNWGQAPAIAWGQAPMGRVSVEWPGRYQRVGKVLIDGAHNPPAARALVEALNEDKYKNLELVCGFCGDKDVNTVLGTLRPLVRHAYAVQIRNSRALTAEQVREKLLAAGIPADGAASPAEAIMLANQHAVDPSAPVTTLVCGSLFLAGEALLALKAYPWPTDRFDPSETINLPVKNVESKVHWKAASGVRSVGLG